MWPCPIADPFNQCRTQITSGTFDSPLRHRVYQHMKALGIWSDKQHDDAKAEIQEAVVAAQREAESHGSLATGQTSSVASMFEDVYEDMPWHLKAQLRRLEDTQ